MEILLLIILAFLVWGMFRKPSNPQVPQESVPSVISDLKELLKNKEVTSENIEELIQKYEGHDQISPQVSTAAVQATSAEKGEQKQSFDITAIMKRWYENNSINLLLYLGAFLIVIAGGAFLTFTWNTLDNVVRFLFFFAFTASFGIWGAVLFKRPSVSQAGITFIGITAILLPLNGIAFQRFILPDPAYPSYILIVTSMLCFAFYMVVFKFIPNRFYAFIINLSTLSIVESFINLASPPPELYIFGGIITAYLMFIAKLLYFRKYEGKIEDTFDVSSQATLIVMIIVGFFAIVQKETLFTFEATTALLLTGIYYALRYVCGERNYFTPANIFVFLSIIFGFHWLKISDIYISTAAFAYVFANLLFMYNLFQKKILDKELRWSVQSSIPFVGVAFFHGILSTFDFPTPYRIEMAWATYFLGGYFVLLYTIWSKKNYIGINFIFSFATYIVLKILNLPDVLIIGYFCALSYLNIGICYWLKEKYKERIEYKWSIYFSLIYTFIAVLYAGMVNIDGKYFTFVLADMCVIFYLIYLLEKRISLLYAMYITACVGIYYLDTFYVKSLLPGATTLPYLYSMSALLGIYLLKDNEQRNAHLSGIILFGIASYISAIITYNEGNFVIVSFVNMLISFYSTFKIKSDNSIYIPNFLLYVFVYSFSSYQHVTQYYFLFSTIVSGLIYSLTMSDVFNNAVINQMRKNNAIHFSLTAAFFHAILAGFSMDILNPVSLSHVATLALCASYFSHYWYKVKPKYIGYLASFLWLCVGLKTFYYFNIQNSNYYFQPVFYYIIACGIYNYVKGKMYGKELMIGGMVLSIGSLFLQSFGITGVSYAVYLMAVSFACIGLGISFKIKELRYGGLVGIVLAVFAQTSEYIFNLPRWLFIGILGLVIISLATYLMSRKKK